MTVPFVRFAPSPTGYIHLGNARTALLNWCFAKSRGGRFLLRYDDTDLERSKEEYALAIAHDLAWLGIHPDAMEKQSARGWLYDAAAEKLKASGRLYACYETEDELDKKRRLARASHRPPVYDRVALKLTAEEKVRFEQEGRRPHWRFLLDIETVAWSDLVRGEQTVEASSLSDPVLIRADGTPLYTFTSVVDDADLGITHVIRGEDHVTNTAVQIQIFRALGAEPPVFGHHNLLTTAAGAGLSKRDGSLSLKALREDGFEGMAVASLATLVGSAEAVRPLRTMEELSQLIDLSKLSRAPARVDEEELAALNARLVHELAYEDAAARLEALGVGGGAAFWLAVRGNLSLLPEAAIWWRVARYDDAFLAPEIDDADAAFFAEASALLPPEPWDQTTWKTWTSALGAATGRKGKALFHPLRRALTGHDSGPELALFLPFIAWERTSARLNAQARSR